MNKLNYTLYTLFKSYNQALEIFSVYKVASNQFTPYDFMKELFNESINHLAINPLYKEFIKAYVK